MSKKLLKRVVATLCAASMATAAIAPSVGAVRCKQLYAEGGTQREMREQKDHMRIGMNVADKLNKTLEVAKRFYNTYKDNKKLKDVVTKTGKLLYILDNWEILNFKTVRFGMIHWYWLPFLRIEGKWEDLEKDSKLIKLLCENIDYLRLEILFELKYDLAIQKGNEKIIEHFDKLFNDIKLLNKEDDVSVYFQEARKAVEARKVLGQPLAKKESKKLVAPQVKTNNNPVSKRKLVANVKEPNKKHFGELLGMNKLHKGAGNMKLKENKKLVASQVKTNNEPVSKRKLVANVKEPNKKHFGELLGMNKLHKGAGNMKLKENKKLVAPQVKTNNNPVSKRKLVANVKELRKKFEYAMKEFDKLWAFARDSKFLKENKNLSIIAAQVIILGTYIDEFDIANDEINALDNKVNEYCKLINSYLSKTEEYKKYFKEVQVKYDKICAYKLQLKYLNK